MYLVSVIPITKQPLNDELSYYSRHQFPTGSVITVPLRKRLIDGLVTSCSEVSDAKSTIRRADFSLQKITTKKHRFIVRPECMEAVEKMSTYYASSLGTTLFAVLPSAIRSDTKHAHAKLEKKQHTTRYESLMLQAPLVARAEEYRNTIRGLFAKKQSVFVVVPTIHEVGRLSTLLSRGIEHYLFTLHSGYTKKQQQERWEEIRKTTHPIVVIMTGSFLTLPRTDLGAIIIEREQTSSYKAQTKPYIDTRQFAEALAQAYDITLIRCDLPLSVETMHAYTKQTCDALKDIPTRLIKGPRYKTIDMRTPQTGERDRKPVVTSISRELFDALSTTLGAGERAFLFVARRGLAPITVCSDCGSRVSCHACQAPVILHKAGREHLFICHACGAMRSSNESCATCTSWRLTTLGIGRQMVEQELTRMFPDTPVFSFDRDVVKTRKQARDRIEQFYQTPGSILLGTEMGLLYLTEPVPLSGVISLDSLLSIPEWNIYERIMSLLVKTREMTTQEMLVQTRKPDDPILALAERGALGEFYKEEIAERKQYQYPPFTLLIKISVHGKSEEIRTLMRHIAESLADVGFSAIPQLLQTPKGVYVMHGFVRLPKSSWPNQQILDFLKTLPPSVRIEVDPLKIL